MLILRKKASKCYNNKYNYDCNTISPVQDGEPNTTDAVKIVVTKHLIL